MCLARIIAQEKPVCNRACAGGRCGAFQKSFDVIRKPLSLVLARVGSEGVRQVSAQRRDECPHIVLLAVQIVLKRSSNSSGEKIKLQRIVQRYAAPAARAALALWLIARAGGR